jgi:hypothetical protein
MNDYVRHAYGDPCRTCGYDWSRDEADCRTSIAAAPARYAAICAGHDGREQLVGLEWNAGAYVAHAADNTRIWAERLAAAALGAPGSVTGYDQDLLASARGYATLQLEGSLWLLARGVGDWHDAEARCGEREIEITHPDMGPLPRSAVRRIVLHELVHHELDVAEILQA